MLFKKCFFKILELLFLKDFIYLFIYFREGEGKERNTNVWLPLTDPLLGTWACNPGVCPDWESNQ